MKSHLIGSMLALLGVFMTGVVQGQTPLDFVAFQGRATTPEGDPLSDGAFLATFALFDSEDSPNLLWGEVHENLPIAGGLFTVMLGSVTPFPAGLFETDSELWLQIAIDSNGNGLDQADAYSPRTPLNSVPVAFHAKNADTLGGEPASNYATLDSLADKIDRDAESYLVVETTDNPLGNGANLLAAYQEAKTRFPYGLDLSETNRFAVILPPGLYQLTTSSLILDAEFIDLIGLSPIRQNQLIYGTANGPSTGVLEQTANDVAIENLTIDCVLNVGSISDAALAACAYYPADNLEKTRVRNCTFRAIANHARSMRTGIQYSGSFIDCEGGRSAFGGGGGYAGGEFIDCVGAAGSFGGDGGDASGRFRDCSAGAWSFGGLGGEARGVFMNCSGLFASFGGAGGIASGEFTQCRGDIDTFGGGNGGVAGGTFVRCIGASGSFGGNGGTASGHFIHCKGANLSFGARGIASGVFENCIGDIGSFGGDGGTASGTFRDCVASILSFGGEGGFATGSFINCNGTESSFGGNGGTASGRFVNCTGTFDSFGGNSGGTASGVFIDCTAVINSFGGGVNSTASGEFRNCRAGSNSFGNNGDNSGARLIDIVYDGFTTPFTGYMFGCTYTADPIVLGDGARIFNSVFYGDVDLAASTAGIAHCSVGGKIGGVENAAFNQFNMELVDVQ